MPGTKLGYFVMKRFFILFFASLFTISSWALTRKEFCQNGNGQLQVGEFLFKENGTGVCCTYVSGKTFEYDGAQAAVSFNTVKRVSIWDKDYTKEYHEDWYNNVVKDAILNQVEGDYFKIPFTWNITEDNRIVVKFGSSFSYKPSSAEIKKWRNNRYVNAQYVEIKKRANQWYQKVLKEKSVVLGQSIPLDVKEKYEHGTYYLSLYLNENEKEVGRTHSSSPFFPSTCHESSQYVPQITTASYPYGDNGINKYVKQYLKYPNNVQQNGINASAYFTLDVGANGKVTSVSTGSVNGTVDQQVIDQTQKLLKQLPSLFTPATEDGRNIASTYEVRIDYELSPAIQLEKQSVSLPHTQTDEKIKVTSRKDWTFTQPTNSSINVRRDGKYLVVSCKDRNENDYDAINDRITVYTTDNSASYDISISQAGAPRPFIRLEKAQVVIPRSGTAQTVSVNSNRNWFVTNSHANSKIKIYTSPTYLTIEAKKNLSKNGRSAIYELKTQDGEYSTSLEVYQNGRSDETFSTSTTSGYGRIYEDYYTRNGKYGITWANLKLGVGAVVPTFDELYMPVNLEAFAIRMYMVELSLASFRADFSLDGFDGFAWEPQVKFLLPINEKVAILPYAGPVCQMDIDDIHNRTWNFSAGAIVRLSWGRIAFSDFSIDYHGGPYGGLSVGVSIGFASGYAN